MHEKTKDHTKNGQYYALEQTKGISTKRRLNTKTKEAGRHEI